MEFYVFKEHVRNALGINIGSVMHGMRNISAQD